MSGAEAESGRSVARRLLRQSRQGALATLMPDGGAPYCSLVAVASHPDGSPLLLISRLAVHTRNLLGDIRISLLLSDRDAPDPLQAARIMIAGRAQILEDADGMAMARRRYLTAHPAAELFVDFPDFLFVRLVAEAIHLVAGFGRIQDLTAAEVLTDLTGAEGLLAAEEGAVAHMNDDHADALRLYATRPGDPPESRDWRCTGLDPDGLDLIADGNVRRVEFPARVTSAAALRTTLVAMAAKVRLGTGPR